MLTHWGHGVLNKSLVQGRGRLDVGGNDDSMFPQVQEEGVACPALGFHHIKRHTLEEVFKH